MRQYYIFLSCSERPRRRNLAKEIELFKRRKTLYFSYQR